MSGEGAAAQIRAAADVLWRDASSTEPTLADARVLAILWATVELERAERELGEVLGGPLHAGPAPRDAALGATVRVAHPFGRSPEPALLLVEPDTEGRLAALLARHGEGVVAVDLEVNGAMRRVEITSDRGGRPPRGPSGHPPEAGA